MLHPYIAIQWISQKRRSALDSEPSQNAKQITFIFNISVQGISICPAGLIRLEEKKGAAHPLLYLYPSLLFPFLYSVPEQSTRPKKGNSTVLSLFSSPSRADQK